jgi:hypothetical protein
MTMTAEHLAALAHNGYTDPEPLMRTIATLERGERERLSRLLPWPRERFSLGAASEDGPASVRADGAQQTVVHSGR